MTNLSTAAMIKARIIREQLEKQKREKESRNPNPKTPKMMGSKEDKNTGGSGTKPDKGPTPEQLEKLKERIKNIRKRNPDRKFLNTGKTFQKLSKGGLKGNQKAIASKAPPYDEIGGNDFAVLRKEKAKGRGMGLQDEKVKPGKVMKAKRGKFLRPDPTKPISSVKPLGSLGGAKNMKVSKAHSNVLGKMNKDKLKAMVKAGKNPDLKDIKGSSRMSSMEAKSFLERRKKLAGAKSLIGKGGRIGAAAALLGLAGAGAAKIGQTIGRKIDEAKKKNKKMGGGMIGSSQMPGYSTGKSITVKTKLGRNKPTKMY